MTSPDPAKAGKRTTEFWLTLLTQLVAAVVAVSAALGLRLDSGALQAAVPAVAVLAAALSQIFYGRGRAQVKVAALAATTAAPQTAPAPVVAAPADLARTPPEVLDAVSADLRHAFGELQALRARQG